MDQMYQPTTCGFLAEAGPPTPEKNEPMSTASGPSSLTTTTQLPANLPTYAPMAPPIGLLPVPIGMPPRTQVASARCSPFAGPGRQCSNGHSFAGPVHFGWTRSCSGRSVRFLLQSGTSAPADDADERNGRSRRHGIGRSG